MDFSTCGCIQQVYIIQPCLVKLSQFSLEAENFYSSQWKKDFFFPVSKLESKSKKLEQSIKLACRLPQLYSKFSFHFGLENPQTCHSPFATSAGLSSVPWPLPGAKLWSNEDGLPNRPVAVEELDLTQKAEGTDALGHTGDRLMLNYFTNAPIRSYAGIFLNLLAFRLLLDLILGFCSNPFMTWWYIN